MSDRESRIDETARALFVMWCSELNGRATPAHAHGIALNAYAFASALEEARNAAAWGDAPVAKPCRSCGGVVGVTLDADPYASEIHGDHTPVWMCSGCREASAGDV